MRSDARGFGVMIADYVIILANSVSLLFLLGLLYFKLRPPKKSREKAHLSQTKPQT
jgi:hypothetical protein